MSQDSHKRFGRYLKGLRTHRELTLRESAKLSRMVSQDSAGQFSHAYLSQLEGGVRASVSLAKMLSLAAICAVPVDELIAKAPPGERRRLRQQLADWREHGQQIPRLLRCLPRQKRAIAEAMEQELRLRAMDVSFPLGCEFECMNGARDAIAWATIIPYVEEQGIANLLHLFRMALRHDIDELLEPAQNWEFLGIDWRTLANNFSEWLQYDYGAGPDLVGLVQRWSLDVTPVYQSACRLSCAFADPDIDARFGFTGIPIGALTAVRWRQLIRLLFDAGLTPEGDQSPAPPDMREAVIDTLSMVIDPTLPEEVTNVHSRRDTVANSISALVEWVPYLKHDPATQTTAEIRALAEFLARATS